MNAQIAQIKAEMSKFEEQLEDCRKYKAFLDKLTPPEWFEEQEMQRMARKVGRAGTYSASGAVSATRGGFEGTDGGRAHASPLGLACVQVCKSAEMTAWCGRRCPTLRLVREQVSGDRTGHDARGG